MKLYFHLFILLVIFQGCVSEKSGSQGKDFTDRINNNNATNEKNSDSLTFFQEERNPIPYAFHSFPSGCNRPQGWILEMMNQDIQHGLVGALDELYPGIKADDLYHTARRGGMEDIPEMGDLELTGEEWETSIMWWNSETIGNWWDGFIRHAFYTNNLDAIEQSKNIVTNLMSSQDEDGYIGIYKSNLRYQHEGSNGELWSQTTAFRMLLAYYEITQNEEVLKAVEKAMSVTMKNYNKTARNPFDLKNAFGGVTHGLMMTDVCETLYRITEKQVYQDYATYLYEAFSMYNINRAFNDMRYPFLLKKDEPFTGHGVHTYEHFRTLLNAYYQTGYEELRVAYDNALFKLDQCILPSGAGHAMEWIGGKEANPTNTAAEYCTMLELRNFFGTAAQKTGEIHYADKAEKLTFNGLLGARNHNGTAISYGKPDNCYKLNGRSLDDKEKEVRFKYSPTHSEPAVCCAPNYTRNLTYYLDQMWGKKEDGIAAILYGPSDLKTYVKNTKIRIEQITNYPFDDNIQFKLSLDQPTEFTLYFRKPSWADSVIFEDVEVLLKNDFYQIKKKWKSGDEIVMKLDNKIKSNRFRNGENYIQRGPIVYALEIPHREETIKTYSIKGFKDYYCHPKNEKYKNLSLQKDQQNFQFHPGVNPKIEAKFKDQITQESKSLNLIPMGKTVLRRVTFPIE